ncbi:DUF6984 family protein [Cytophaga aurantiaca]|uniref:DUF6984 family protein n=1 Tax=Cytophaga aurantiaca TaxID=29530 RepID=UPI0003644E44|nr:hypothetical protein [Cytophaga aurantiaca]
MNIKRTIREEEKEIVKFLLVKINSNEAEYPISDTVEEYEGSHMGSINLNNPNTDQYDSDLIQAEYTDADKIPVVLSLTKDKNGKLLDLDFWKSDFSALVKYPKPEELMFV